MTVASIREALHGGRLMEAVDAARDALIATPGDFEAAYLKALALSRLGAADAAAALLRQVLDRDDVPDALRAEALALDGRLCKDRLAGLAPEATGAQASLACRRYEEAFALVPSAFAAINAASLCLLAGDAAGSARFAREAARLAGLASAPDHWSAATLGEAALLQGDVGQARERYRQAHALAGQRHGDVASMRRQLRLIARCLPEAQSLMREIPAPTVVAFTGHMVDAPGRAMPRFPPALEPLVGAAIARWLDGMGVVVGYSQAACGADILFLEALQRRGLETNVLLPCAHLDYVEQSVAFAGGAWMERFERALAGATTVSYATAEAYLGDEVLFEHASRLIDGQALLRARQLEGNASMLAVLDAGSAAGAGGTYGTLRDWTDAGRHADVIDVAALRGVSAPPADVAAAKATPRASRLGRVIVWIVFADVRGFSTLPEQHSPRFAERFLGEARDAMRACGKDAHTSQSAGDGVYVTFGSARAAASFAIDLRDRVKRVDWTQFGMSRDTTVRVAAHGGPAFPIMCPLTDRPNYCGTHIIRTARVEPVVTPGEVFVTDAMAAYLALEAAEAFECDYLGVLPLAKGAGSSALYRLRRKPQATG